ncbi:MAG: FAD-dependent oxidoreductase [Candidatus Omnitrophica bacterium]|nr:FAD-dependent oxidoreductase [Candidatus Omnitrophota bacterium]
MVPKKVMRENKTVVVLGAGLAGLSAAWALRKNGYRIVILEKLDRVGGLAITKSHDEYRYDLGPHNIHTVHNHVLTFLERHFSQTLFTHDPTSKILKNGKLIDYPLKGIRVITSLSLWKLPIVGASFFVARLRMFLSNPQRDNSFQDWITNRFGRQLYNEYFGNYAGKVWSIHPSQIDKYVAEKRIPVVGLTALIRAAIFRQSPKIDHPEFLEKNFYLRNGIGETVDFFESELRTLGVEAEKQVEITGVQQKDDKVTGVSYTDKFGVRQNISCDYLLSTIPVSDFIRLLENVPESVRSAATKLDYCSTVLVFLKTRALRLFPSTMLYFSDPLVSISRVYDVGSYSRAMVPEGKSLFCAELPCNFNDATWGTANNDLGKRVAGVFMDHGMLKADDIDGTFVERISHSYPRFRVGFKDHLRVCFRYIEGIRNCVSYGRQGGFAYLNTDGVIHLGMNAADAVMLAESMNYTCPEWFNARTRATGASL